MVKLMKISVTLHVQGLILRHVGDHQSSVYIPVSVFVVHNFTDNIIIMLIFNSIISESVYFKVQSIH